MGVDVGIGSDVDVNVGIGNDMGVSVGVGGNVDINGGIGSDVGVGVEPGREPVLQPDTPTARITIEIKKTILFRFVTILLPSPSPGISGGYPDELHSLYEGVQPPNQN